MVIFQVFAGVKSLVLMVSTLWNVGTPEVTVKLVVAIFAAWSFGGGVGTLNVTVADVVEPGATWTVTGRLTLDPCVTTCGPDGTLSSKSNSLVGLG